MRYLLTVTETYRVDTEEEVDALIAEAKNSSDYELAKYSREYKEKKSKGEVEDSWYRATLTKKFTGEKEPIRTVEVSYE